MANSERRLDLLQRAIDVFVAWREDPAGVGAEEFLAAHPDLRPLLEPMVYPPVATDGPESSEARIEVGARLGDYELLRLLGEGGMGRVFEAEQGSLQRRVTIKVLHPELTRTPAEIERFRREASAAARLRHPGIVPIFEVGERGGVHFFVMEHVAGTPLNALVPDGLPAASTRARWEFAARVVAEAAEALEYAHGEGVVHRDVKPHNLLLTDDGTVRLLDFGLASATRRGPRAGSTDRVTLVGTPNYMSPEQARGEPVGPPSDVFSAGVVLFELISGRRPFDGPSTTAVLERITAPAPARVADVVADVPRELASICDTCLQKSVGARYPTAAALAADLRAWLAGMPVSVVTTGPVRRFSGLLRRHPAITMAVVLAGALLVVVPLLYDQHEARVGREREQTRAAATLAVEAVQQLVAVLDDRLARQQELEPGYGRQIEAAISLCEERLADAATEPGHRRLLAAAVLDAAAIYPRLGDPSKALGPLQVALDALAEPTDAAADPGGAAATRALTARTLGVRARIHYSVYDPRAHADLRLAAIAWRELIDDDTWAATARPALARLAILEARMELDTLDGLERAEERLQRARELLAPSPPMDAPESTPDALTRCRLHVVAGKLWLHRDDAAAAAGEFAAAGQRLSEHGLAAGHPGLQAQQLYGAGVAALGQNDRDTARECFAAALRAIEVAVARYPSDAGHRRTRAAVRYRLGFLHLLARRYPAALDDLQLAFSDQDEVLQRCAEPAARDRMAFAVTCTQLANCHLLRRPPTPEAARPLYERALAVQAALHEGDPDVVTHLTELGATHSNLAAWENQFGDAAAAREHATRAIELQLRAYDRRPDMDRVRKFLAIHHAQLACAEERLGENDAAVAAAGRAVEFYPTHAASIRMCVEVVARLAVSREDPPPAAVTEELQRKCVSWLRGLTRGSARGVDRLLRSARFDSLRDRADFQQLLREVSR